MKELRLKQDPLFIVVPLFFDLLLFVGALFMSGIWKYVGIVMAVTFAVIVLWQSRPLLRNFELLVRPREIIVKDFRGKAVRRLDWKKVEGVAAGFKRTWKLYTYSFYFRVRGEEDLLFVLVSREEGLTAKFQKFVKVFVRKKVPVQTVKA
ncbi:MAG: hypothetical protein ABGX12_01710 [Desulfurobacteriaceae bacterium]